MRTAVTCTINWIGLLSLCLVTQHCYAEFLLVSSSDGLTSTNGRVNGYDAVTGAFIGTIVPAFSNDVINGVASHNGSLFLSVFDTVTNSNGRILRFDVGTGAMSTFVAPGSGGLVAPFQLIFGPDNNLYVINNQPGVDQVLRFNGSTGAFLDTFATGLSIPQDLTFGPNGDLFVSNGGTSSVSRFNGTTGTSLGQFIPSGSGGLFVATGLTFGPDGNLYVASTFSGSVLRYDGQTGAYLDVFVLPGSGGLSFPNNVVFGPDGNLYLDSRTSVVISGGSAGEVLRFDGTTGAFIDSFTGIGSGGLGLPRGGLIFIEDSISIPEPSAVTTWLILGGVLGLFSRVRLACSPNSDPEVMKV